MKRQIQIFAATLILGCGIFTSSQAQPQTPMLPDSTHIVQRVDEMAEALSLSDQQKTDILKLYFEHFGQVKEMHNVEKARHEGMRQKHEALRAQFEDSISRLLSDEQKTEYEDFLKTHQPPKPEGGPGAGGQMGRRQMAPKQGTVKKGVSQ